VNVSTTRAVRIERWGPPESLVDREIPLSEPGPGEVHLRVEAAGVNFADLAMRMGMYSTVPPRPFSPGFEVAGRVERCGPEVEGLAPGRPVVALLRHGGYAHDVIARAENVFPRPAAWDPAFAAAVPVVFLTAWTCLFAVGRATAEETALILGAGGGVGTAAVQLAVDAGLRVFGTAGTEAKRRFVVEELGAAACFDSRSDWAGPLTAAVGPGGLDLALDPVGGVATRRCRALLGPLGRLVFYGMSEALPGRRRSWWAAAKAWLRTPRFHPLALVEPNLSVGGVHLLHLGRKEPLLRRAFEEMLPRFDSGRLRPVLDSTFELDADGAAAAHARLHARENLGKVVLLRSD
jgi:NADPH:quinone reductase-like Zn-dependent oxidoreductase